MALGCRRGRGHGAAQTVGLADADLAGEQIQRGDREGPRIGFTFFRDPRADFKWVVEKDTKSFVRAQHSNLNV